MRTALIIISLLLVVACGVGTYVYKGMQAAAAKKKDALTKTAVVSQGDLKVQVIETGTIDAVKAVEVKSRASGRLAQLLVEEGDLVRKGQLIARIDPKETQLQLEQNQAQLAGATSGVQRSTIEIDQRRRTANATLIQTEARLSQLREEVRAQPVLTRSAVSSAQASLDTAKKELERLRTSAHPNARMNAEAVLREAEASFANVERDYERQQLLVRQGYIAGKAAEDARLAKDLAQIRVNTARDNLLRLDTQHAAEIARAQDDIRRAQAEVDRSIANQIQDKVKQKEYESAMAEVAKARVALRDVDAMRKAREQSQYTVVQLRSVRDESLRQLNETEIRSPIDGVVTKKLIQEGELVASLSSFSSGTAIVRLEDRTALRVLLNINEIDVAKLKVGIPAEIQVDAFPAEKFHGVVKKIAPASNNTGLTPQGQAPSTDTVVKYAVEIWMDDPDSRLRSGMSAKCTLVVDGRDDVLQLPVEFVGTDKDGSRYVNVVDPKAPEATPKKVKVTVGLTTGALIEIKSGVKKGDRIGRPEFSGPARKGMMEAGGPD